MQAKLHRWAVADPGRRFDDLFNFVYDPATLIVAFDRVAGNRGARTPGVDGLTVADVEEHVGVPGFLDDLRAALKDGSFRPLPVRERKIPKPGGSGKVRSLGIPTVADRVVQAALKLVLEPIFEADFQPVSYGFRPRRRAHDAIAEIHHFGTRGYRWVLDADIEACFDSIDHTALMDRVRARVKDKRVLALVKAFLQGRDPHRTRRARDTLTGTPQGGILTPPTQWAIGRVSPSESVSGLLSGVLVVRSRCGMEWRMVILSGPTRTSLTSSRRTRWRSATVAVAALFAQLGEEVFEVVGELEVDLAVGELGVEGVDLLAQAGLAGAQLGHPGPEFVEGDQLFLVGADEPCDRLAGLGQRRRRAVCVGRWRGRRCGPGRAVWSISVRISAGSASRSLMWSQTTASR